MRARILSYSYCGVDPKIMGIGPVPAVRKALERAGQVARRRRRDRAERGVRGPVAGGDQGPRPRPEKVNPNGGAIALGHPIAATGAVITTKILYEMERGTRTSAW